MQVLEGIGFEEYRALDAWNFSALKHAKQTVAHAKAAKDGLLDDDTEAKGFGTISHLCLLQPDDFKALVVKGPDVHRNTKDWKTFAAENAGKILVKGDELERHLAIREQVWSNRAARALLNNSRRELSITWTHEPTLLPCKGRLDVAAAGIVADFKTCTSADPTRFSKAIYDHQYHVQGAMYVEAAQAAFDQRHEYAIIAAEKDPPYAVAVYRLDARALEIGERHLNQYRRAVAHAIRTGRWDAYPRTIEDIGLPAWVEKMEEAFDVRE